MRESIECRIIGNTRAIALMVPELVVELDLGLDLRRKVFEIVREANDGPRIEVVRDGRYGDRTVRT